MKKNFVLYILLVVVAIAMSACGTSQYNLRGDNGGTPGVRVTPMMLGVTQEELATMSKKDYIDLMNRIDRYNASMQRMSYTEAYDAYAKKQWVNDSEGAPPAPPFMADGKAKTAKTKKKGLVLKEGERVVRDAVRMTSKEIRKEIREAIKDAFD